MYMYVLSSVMLDIVICGYKFHVCLLMLYVLHVLYAYMSVCLFMLYVYMYVYCMSSLFLNEFAQGCKKNFSAN